MTEAFPLQWPLGWPRTAPLYRKEPKFNAMDNGEYRFARSLTIPEAVKRLADEIAKIGGRNMVISTNLQIGTKGTILANQRKPEDPGVCVYFQLKNSPTTLPCDKYRSVEGNIAAIAAHIAATRAIERHGVGTLAQMFTGFQAIRGPGSKPWREVLGIKPETFVNRDLIRQRRIDLAKVHHSDIGGNDAQMAEINSAYDRALQEINQ